MDLKQFIDSIIPLCTACIFTLPSAPYDCFSMVVAYFVMQIQHNLSFYTHGLHREGACKPILLNFKLKLSCLASPGPDSSESSPYLLDIGSL